jgi:predicted TIM-barrel fold metal-dependent hydrolase
MIDVNAYLSRWPFKRLPGDEPADFVARMRKVGITQSWAGSFDALLHRDIEGVNARLAADCKVHGAGLLVPFGAVNPKLPDWREDLRRCREVYRMPGIRLHPNYHGYSLRDPEFADVVKEAAGAGMIVQLAVQMEDERTQHPLVRVPIVDLSPLEEIVRGVPSVRMVVLNAWREPQRKRIAAMGNVWFDMAMIEGVAGVAALAGEISPGRVMFGTYFPFFNLQSSILKIREAGLSAADEKAITVGNASGLIALGAKDRSK